MTVTYGEIVVYEHQQGYYAAVEQSHAKFFQQLLSGFLDVK